MKKFFREAVSELHNVTWPTKKHAINIARITLGFTLVSAVFMWVMDYIFSESYSFISKLNPKNNVIIQTPTDTWAKVTLDWKSVTVDSSSWKVIINDSTNSWNVQ